MDGLEFSPEPVPGDGVERRERFVKEQDAGPEDERPGDRRPLLLPAGERQGGAVKEMTDPEQVCGFRNALLDPVGFDLLLPEAKPYILPDGEVGEEHVVLVDHADPPVFRVGAGDLPAVEADRPRSGRIDPRDRLEEDGLSRTGRPEYDEVFAGTDGQVHAVEGEFAEGEGESPDVEHQKTPRPSV